MTAGKASALAAGFVGALALGIAIGATMDDKWSNPSTTETAVTENAPAPAPAPAAEPARKPRPAPAKAAAKRVRPAPAPAGSVTTVAVDMWEPELRDRAKAVLNPGTKIDMAAADFATAEEFMTVAHAARNTQVPFMVLKHRVLDEQRSWLRPSMSRSRSRRQGGGGARARSGASGRGVARRSEQRGPDRTRRGNPRRVVYTARLPTLTSPRTGAKLSTARSGAPPVRGKGACSHPFRFASVERTFIPAPVSGFRAAMERRFAMSRQISPATSLITLRREAKRWLKQLHVNDSDAQRRFEKAYPNGPAAPVLRDVQHALAREFGLEHWAGLRKRSNDRQAKGRRRDGRH